MRKRKINGENVVEYTENPFLRHTAEISRTGQKPVYVKTQSGVSVFMDDGSVHAASIIYQQEVEANGYIKVYAEGIGAILGLSPAGREVFKVIYGRLYGKKGMDKTEIVLNYNLLSEAAKNKMSARTFSRGINDCIRAKLIASSVVSNLYFVNPAYIYNGNRLNIIKQYINKEAEKAEEEEKNKTIEASNENDGN